MIEKDYILSPHTFDAAENCAAARVFRGPPQKPNHAQWHGIAVHRYIEYARTRGRKFALAYIARKFKSKLTFCESINLEVFPEGTYEAQYLIDTKLPMAVMLDACDNIKSEAHWRDHIIVKTDLVAYDEPWVIDFKAGKANKTRPGTSTQSLIEAVATYLARGRTEAVRASIFVVSKDNVEIHNHLFSKDDMEKGLQRLQRVHLQVRETRAEYHEENVFPEYEPGPHCSRCSAQLVCPKAYKETPKCA